MSVRKALGALREGRLGGLSTGYYSTQTALRGALDSLAGYEARTPQPRSFLLDEVSIKVDHCLDRRSCALLERRDWKIVPWVMWHKSNAADEGWFLEHLFEVLSAPSRPLSAIRALVHSYVAYFDPGRRSIHKVAFFLRNRGLSEADAFSQRWLLIDQRFAIFEPAKAVKLIATHAINAPDLRIALSEAGISTDRIGDSLARRAFDAATEAVARELKSVEDQLALRRAVDRLIAWNTDDDRRARYLASMFAMATRLLEALGSSNASTETVDALLRYFVDVLGDPRINRARWLGVSQAALDIAIRLLVRSTLDDFFRVISATAEARHWQERKRFWLAYYEAGALEDAWVAFGPRAANKARDLQQRYASLVNASDDAHSAIIVRIGRLIIVEWSHNGRCRFFPQVKGSWVPGCYEKRYNFQELHNNCPTEYLTHQANWQPKFAAKIYELTGVRHPQLGAGWRY